MVGIPSESHPAAFWGEENLWNDRAGSQLHGRNWYQVPHPRKSDNPLYPGTELDDVSLHFRCGDIIRTPHPKYGFMKFDSYSRYISTMAGTIGIITQPFESNSQQRAAERDEKMHQMCRTLVHAFVDYLEKRFPHAKVAIRNDSNESIALSFARMIMANQTIVGISTFSQFPAVATFGSSFIQRQPTSSSSGYDRMAWIDTIAGRHNNVKVVDESFLSSVEVKKLWGRVDRP